MNNGKNYRSKNHVLNCTHGQPLRDLLCGRLPPRSSAHITKYLTKFDDIFRRPRKVAPQLHQILRLPRKATPQDMKENGRKLHYRARGRSEGDPSMIRERTEASRTVDHKRIEKNSIDKTIESRIGKSRAEKNRVKSFKQKSSKPKQFKEESSRVESGRAEESVEKWNQQCEMLIFPYKYISRWDE